MSEYLEIHNDPELLVLRFLNDPRPDLKDLILVQCSQLVERIARRFNGAEPHEDLVQVGYIGLLNALSKFDPGAGVRFSTYAAHLIAGEIKHYLRDRSQTIRQPAWLQELRHKVSRAAGLLQARLGRAPTDREIADELGISEQTVNEVYQTQQILKVDSIDRPATSDDEEGDCLDMPAECRQTLGVEDRVVLAEAIRQLRDLERQVLVHFHFDSMSQTEIAARLGISCNYVSHILRQSLAKLRRILAQEDEQDRMLRATSETSEEGVIDPITGVYSFEYFESRCREEIHRASSTDGVLSLMAIEFEGLDKLAGYYGRASVGDFLADAADLLRENVRRLDVLCRLGEQGFGIILRSVGPSAPLVRQRVQHALDRWLAQRQAMARSVAALVRIATYPQEATTFEGLVARIRSSSAKLEVVEGGPATARKAA